VLDAGGATRSVARGTREAGSGSGVPERSPRDPAKPGSDRKGNAGPRSDRDASTAQIYLEARFPHREVAGQAMPDNQRKVPGRAGPAFGLLLLNPSLYGVRNAFPLIVRRFYCAGTGADCAGAGGGCGVDCAEAASSPLGIL
jgi:hypothetical protein